MVTNDSVILGLIFGLISTLLVHIGKAMERQGIDIFSKKKNATDKGKKPLIYIIGFALNNSVLIWQIIAMQFANAAVFSSVFGLGLIVLLLYSHYVLKEKMQSSELLGSVLIVLGTVIIGIVQILEPISSEEMDILKLYMLVLIVGIVLSVVLCLSVKFKIGIAIVFGLVAGVLGGLDNVLKRVGLKKGFVNVGNPQTLPIFLLSFIAGASALIICQIGFKKKADASKLVPMYNSTYIVVPVLIEWILYEIYFISFWKVFAAVLIVIGVFVMHSFKRRELDEKKRVIIALNLLYTFLDTQVKSLKTISLLQKEFERIVEQKNPELKTGLALLFPIILDALINNNLLERITYKSKDAVKKIKPNWNSNGGNIDLFRVKSTF